MTLREQNVVHYRRTSKQTYSGTPAACTALPMINTTTSLAKKNSVTYGANIRDYKQVIAEGGSATTQLSGFRYTSSAGIASYVKSMKPTSPYYRTQGCTSRVETTGQNRASLDWTLASKIASPIAEEQAASSVLRSYIEATHAWRGGNFLAEFAETVKTLRRPLDGIHQHTWDLIRKVTSMKRLFRRSPSDYGRMLGNTWLSWAFGVRPLLSDVASAETAIMEMGSGLNNHDRLPIRGSGLENAFMFIYVNGATPDMDSAVHDSYLRTNSSVRYKGACIARPPGSSQLLSHFGFEPEDIAPAVWEAIPWSFMVDYFVNVGEKIESLRWATANLAWLQRTVRNTTVRGWTNIRAPQGPSADVNFNIVASGGAAWCACTWVSRQPSVPPYPSWKFKIPNSLGQWINIAALAAGIRASKPTPSPFRPPTINIGDL